MFSKNAITTTLVILSTFLFTTSTTNALAISSEHNTSAVQGANYTIADDAVILHSLFGDVKIAIPEEIQTLRRQRNEESKFERLTEFGSRRPDSREMDFFSCTEEASFALTGHTETYRRWEAFFKRHSVDDTMAVRYCCNLLEYVDEAYMTLTPECRRRARLQDEVFSSNGVRYTCRQYEFQSPECFLVRWMYWWIPIAALLLIVLVLLCACCLMRSRRNKEYSRTRQEEKKYRTSLVNGTAI